MSMDNTPPINLEQARDQRDLKILKLLDQGLTQTEVATRMAITRGPIVRLLTDIRIDEGSC